MEGKNNTTTNEFVSVDIHEFFDIEEKGNNPADYGIVVLTPRQKTSNMDAGAGFEPASPEDETGMLNHYTTPTYQEYQISLREG